LGDNFKIVPIVMGTQDWNKCEALGEILGDALKGKKALIVASSDLSHFHPYKEANRLDSTLIASLESYKTEDLCKRLNTRELEACGGGPIVAAMIAGKKLGAEGLKIIKHANSGDVSYGTKDQVVGYLSGIVYRKSSSQNENSEDSMQSDMGYKPLTLEEKRQLMEIAKTTVDCVVRKEKVPEFVPVTETLKEKRGAFVTLTIGGQLRGCIGYIIPIKSLYLTVREVAESAALKDPRFNPVTVRELPKLEFEISALSPIRPIMNVDEIVVGRDGIIIKRGFYQGLLLPQVATDYGWEREEFLQHTCLKAGLPKDAWKQEGTEISIFSAEVFDESQIK
jgi:MEMO1 family protein